MNLVYYNSGNSLSGAKMSSRKAERKRSVFDRLGPSDYEKEVNICILFVLSLIFTYKLFFIDVEGQAY